MSRNCFSAYDAIMTFRLLFLLALRIAWMQWKANRYINNKTLKTWCPCVRGVCVLVCMCMCVCMCVHALMCATHLFMRIFLVVHFLDLHFVVIFCSSEFMSRYFFYVRYSCFKCNMYQITNQPINYIHSISFSHSQSFLQPPFASL